MVRHCEALGNIKHIFQGSTDLDISELGEKQLKELKKRFEEIELDRVYTSPLIRTRKTAEAIIGSKPLKYEICEGLIELQVGVIEGRPIAEVFNEATIWLCVAVAFGATLITAVVRVVGANQPAKNSDFAKGEQPKLGAGAKGQHQSGGKFCAPRSAGMPLEHDQAS